MNLDIKKILPVPDKKINSLKNDWDSIEKKMNFKFPEDYKEFIDTYGAGSINEFIFIFSPFCENKNLNLLNCFKEMEESYNAMKEAFPDDFELEFFNGENGLFPWGVTNNGDELYWNLTEKGFKLLIYDDDYEGLEYSMSMTVFLYKVLNETLVCHAFPNNEVEFLKENNYYKTIE